MKIFIFSESEQAIALREAEKAAGNSAFIRNPQYFNPNDFDASADRVYTDDAAIAEAFRKAGKETAAVKQTPKAAKAAEPEPQPEAKPSVLKKFTKRK